MREQGPCGLRDRCTAVHRSQSCWGNEDRGGRSIGQDVLGDRNSRNKGLQAGKTHQMPDLLEQRDWAGEKRQAEGVRASHTTELLER